ncbi:MAG TPA: CehA/McbA family metallohydrolase [Chloroflexota bacterium]|nr:CehA/McbA family metallohydrolase [Chloroflexota bacterium]
MNNLPFDQPGRFYRGNLHTHSTRSDGALGPAQVIAAYRDHGYDFLAITDHFLENYGFPITDTREFRTPTFTTLLGAELHAPRIEIGQRWHIVSVGLPLDFAPTGATETGPELARRAAATGAFVGIAHPAWYGLTLADALSLDAAHAVEIFNQTCYTDNDRGDSWYMEEMLLARGNRLMAYAADDAHFKERLDYRAAWVQVRAESLDPDALLAAIKGGRFYASQGPEIHHVAIDGDRLRVSCSPASSVFVSGRGPGARHETRDSLTECQFPLGPFAGSYCRVTVIDAAGKRAWTNPIWLS